VHIQEANSLLKEAAQFAHEAEKSVKSPTEDPTHPVVFATQAEIKCIDVEINKETFQDEEKKAARTKEILDLIKKAREEGYDFGRQQDFFEQFPAFLAVQHLAPENYKELLFEAAGVKN
jgi:hypothetical protein